LTEYERRGRKKERERGEGKHERVREPENKGSKKEPIVGGDCFKNYWTPRVQRKRRESKRGGKPGRRVGYLLLEE